MRRAIELAKKGLGFTNPNPMVGAVLVQNNQIISEGYHQAYGGPHAEVHAIGDLNNLEDATLYVTLEPCCHYGKTPPCTEKIIQAGIKKVVVATLDPNPLVAGNGVKILREHGIEVIVGVLEAESRKMNEIFNHFILHQTPFVFMKYAMTLDGKIACHNGQSKWITNEKARRHVHETRQQVMGIMVGVQTIINDDPKLDCRRSVASKDPIAIILDSSGRIPLTAKVLKPGMILATTYALDSEKESILLEKGIEIIKTNGVHGQVDLKALMRILGQKKIDSVLVEGGGAVHGSLLSQGLVNKVQAYIAPKFIGDGIGLMKHFKVDHMSEAKTLNHISITTFDEDILIEGYVGGTDVYRNN